MLGNFYFLAEASREQNSEQELITVEEVFVPPEQTQTLQKCSRKHRQSQKVGGYAIALSLLILLATIK